MCGIAGAIGSIDADIREAVATMSRAIVHRGPDDEGSWRTEVADGRPGVVFEHRRLAIIDISESGHQPMVDPATGAVIIYNGEVYNFRELRSELEQAGVTFQSSCDTEVVLKAYAKWGTSFVERLRGMFAFAIWDPAARHVFIARDRLGIKPLYYCVLDRGARGRVVLFASEVRALLASGLVERRLDPSGVATYAWNGFVTGPATIVRGVRSLPAAGMATISLDDPRVEPVTYWQIPSSSSAAGTVAALRSELEDSVRMRLISDVPLGVFLSGGVDSSAVSALAARFDEGQVKTFNVGFDETEFDESGFAASVAGALGTDHTQVRLTQADFTAELDDALASIDQPTFDQINTYVISRAVREAGITVALAGVGGDELFGGYSSFVDLPRAAGWARRLAFMPEASLAMAASGVSRVRYGRSGAIPPQTRWGKLGDALRTKGRLVDLYQVSYGLFTRAFYERLLNGTDAAEVTFGLSRDRYRELTSRLERNPMTHAISMLELSNFVGERLLRDSDAASMAVSLELRVPLLDHRVVEAVAALDPAERYEPMRSKRLLRELALGDLDPTIFQRPKSGFVLPIERWLRARLRDRVEDLLLDEGLCRSVGLDPASIAGLWDAFQAGAPGVYWSRVWAVFVLLWWCRQHELRV